MNDLIESHLIVDNEPLEYLMILGRETGRDLLGSLVVIYSQDTPTDIQKIRLALLDRSYKEVALIAHSLKSSSLNLGLIVMGSLFAKIEEIAECPQPKDYDIVGLIEDAEAVMKPSMAALSRLVAGFERGEKEF